jgi:2-keto-myo-inositol isomerase
LESPFDPARIELFSKGRSTMTDGNLAGLTRREWLATGALSAVGAAAFSRCGAAPAADSASTSQPFARGVEPFGYCLNTSTIRGQKLELPAQIDVIADAGYSAAELWVRDIEDFARKGGSIEDLAKRIRDRGLSLPSAISFFTWISDNPDRRARGIEQAKKEMDLVRRLGVTRIAAPPAGASDSKPLDLLQSAQRYRALADLGASMGVVPQLELWGFSKSMSRVGEAALVAMESGHPQACLLLDVYHIYKGGSDFNSLRFLSGQVLHVLHVNDYPASPPRKTITDAARVFPGDGIAPFPLILRTLRDVGFRGYLSLEVFNRDYWRQDPHLVARTGLEKMKAAVHKALA